MTGSKNLVLPTILIAAALFAGCASKPVDIDRTLAGEAASPDAIYLMNCENPDEVKPVLLDFFEASALRKLDIETSDTKALEAIERLNPSLAKTFKRELQRFDRYLVQHAQKPKGSPAHFLPKSCELVAIRLIALPANVKQNKILRSATLAELRVSDLDKRGILMHHLLREKDSDRDKRKHSVAYRFLTGWLNSTQLEKFSSGEFAQMLQDADFKFKE